MPNAPGSGLPNPATYDTSVAGIVIDKVTGLVWQKAIDANSYTQPEAEAYCAALVLEGGCWRLPTRIELVSILDETYGGLDKNAFPAEPSAYYWSSSLLPGSPAKAWAMSLVQEGELFWYDVTYTFSVRCVR